MQELKILTLRRGQTGSEGSSIETGRDRQTGPSGRPCGRKTGLQKTNVPMICGEKGLNSEDSKGGSRKRFRRTGPGAKQAGSSGSFVAGRISRCLVIGLTGLQKPIVRMTKKRWGG